MTNTRKEAKESVKANKVGAQKIKQPEIIYVRFQNAHTSVVTIQGQSLRPNEVSRAFTVDQAKMMKKNMQPFIKAGWIKEIGQ